MNRQGGALLHGHGATLWGEGDAIHYAIRGLKAFLIILRPKRPGRCGAVYWSNLT
jgi:hypothetical protein